MWASGGVSSPSITVNPVITTNYNVMYTLNGCVTTSYGTVTVNSIPTVNLSGAVICEGDSTLLNAIPNLPGGVFSWTPGGVVIQLSIH